MNKKILTPQKINKILSNDSLMQSCKEDCDKLQFVIGNIFDLRDKLISLKMDYETLYKEYIKLKNAKFRKAHKVRKQSDKNYQHK